MHKRRVHLKQRVLVESLFARYFMLGKMQASSLGGRKLVANLC